MCVPCDPVLLFLDQSQRNLTHVYKRLVAFYINSETMKTTKMSVNKRMNWQILSYSTILYTALEVNELGLYVYQHI